MTVQLGRFNRTKAIYDADGVTSTFAVPFPYLNKLNVIVSFRDKATGHFVAPDVFSVAFVNPSLIQITPTPILGWEVWVERWSSQFGQLVNFTDGSTITQDNLDLAYRQAWYTAEEARDDAGLYGIAFVDLEEAITAALGYSTSASASATAAAASASAASTSASSAAGSAVSASASAVAAAASAAVAASGVGAIGLLKANNLSDLVSSATARTNLGLDTMALEATGNWLSKAGNLAGLANTATARANLGVTNFDATIPGPIGGTTPDVGTFTKVNVPSGSNSTLGIAGTTATTDGIALNTGWTAFVNAGQYGLYVQRGTQVGIRSDTPLGWGSSGANNALGLKLYYDADNILAQRNGTNAQIARIYNTFTDASNYERLSLGYVSNVLLLKHEALGTGSVLRGMALSANSIGFRPANAGGDVWTMLSGSGNFVPGTDNNYDFGSSTARVRDFYLSRWADIGAYREAVVQTPAISAGVVTLDCSLGNTFVVSVTAAITSWTINNVPATGKGYDLRIILVSDGTSRAVAWPAAFNWGTSAAVATTNATVSKETHVLASTRNNGTAWQVTPADTF